MIILSYILKTIIWGYIIAVCIAIFDTMIDNETIREIQKRTHDE